MATLRVEQGLIERLRTDPSITALVGSGTSARISEEFPSEDSPLPFISLRRATSDYRHHINGTASRMQADIQIDVWAKTLKAAHDLADLIRTRLNTYTGTLTIDADTLTVDHCYIDSDNTGFVTPRGGTDARMKRISHDYTVWVRV